MKLHAFVAMPFGVKKDSLGNAIDFNRVYAELIKPDEPTPRTSRAASSESKPAILEGGKRFMCPTLESLADTTEPHENCNCK